MLKKERERRRPTPPNFRRIPAKSIEPKVGASTCAIGNQKCKPYKGSLTEKTKNVIKDRIAGKLLWDNATSIERLLTEKVFKV